jgi:hypothetical protein
LAATPDSPKPLPATAPAADGSPLRELHDVELFAVGDHDERGEPFTADHLREIAHNFAFLRDNPDFHHEPACALGHDEDQADLRARLRDDAEYRAYVERMDGSDPFKKRTSAAAAGWPDEVTFDPATGKLTAKKIGYIPPTIGGMIDRRELRYPSVELYRPFKHEGKEYGLAIRRIALLGAHPPAVKKLKPFGRTVPALAFSEREDGFGRYVFAESAPMTRTEKIAAVKARYPALPAAVVEALSDELLDATAAAPEPEGGGKPKPQPEPGQPVPTQPPGVPNPTPKPGQPSPSAPQQPTPEPAAALAFAELEQRYGRLEERARRREAEEALREKINREKVVDDLLTWASNRTDDHGRPDPAVLPYMTEKNPRVPNLRTELLAADNTHAMAFGEQSLTPFERLVAQVKGTPSGIYRGALAFGERVAQGGAAADEMPAARRSELLSYTTTGRAILRDEAAALTRAR